ncbi:hypothetical protein [Pedobacter cryoconitis]|uniref:DUF2157 domain-containing protein n=1 Tax=Pedobacter cryoconitis TaxID=188932 RepID=A0A7X0J2D9_9SPHI|nr:hypothetical protein [Pedobacter cryoconitis]MBB6499613.1 hypothetical protein [Pedobacter cryoconitis]
MIIYNKIWLANLSVQQQLRPALDSGELSKDEFKNIEAAYPVGFYSPNIFVRVGLFILTNIIAVVFGCLLTYMLLDSDLIKSPVWYFFLGLFCYIVLEFVVRRENHFRSGADDALTWISAGLILAGFLILLANRFPLYDSNSITKLYWTAGIVFLLSSYYTIRFTDSLMAIMSFLSLVFFAAVLWYNSSAFGAATLPFLVILLSGIIYYFSLTKTKQPALIYYQHCISLVQITSLVTLYLSGNYYVVQKLGTELYGYTTIGPYKVPYPVFFWPWTILVPFIYTGAGVYRKNVILLRTGLILIAIAAVTFKSYYHVLPIEGTLVLIGIVTLGGSYWLIRYLKMPKHGFTYEELAAETIPGGINVESLIIASTQLEDTPKGTQSPFGGGDFGGGGSSSDF